MKLGKISYITCMDMESLIRKIYGCANNPENSSTAKRVSIFLLDIQCWALYNLGILSFGHFPRAL